MFIPRSCPREIKVVYNHTCFASYLHFRVGNVGSEYAYRLLKGNEYFTAGGFPSNPILFGSVPNRPDRCPSCRGTRWPSSRACPSWEPMARPPLRWPQKAPISHHPQPWILAIVIGLITMSSSIFRMPTRNNSNSATAAVGLLLGQECTPRLLALLEARKLLQLCRTVDSHG